MSWVVAKGHLHVTDRNRTRIDDVCTQVLLRLVPQPKQRRPRRRPSSDGLGGDAFCVPVGLTVTFPLDLPERLRLAPSGEREHRRERSCQSFDPRGCGRSCSRSQHDGCLGHFSRSTRTADLLLSCSRTCAGGGMTRLTGCLRPARSHRETTTLARCLKSRRILLRSCLGQRGVGVLSRPSLSRRTETTPSRSASRTGAALAAPTSARQGDDAHLVAPRSQGRGQR